VGRVDDFQALFDLNRIKKVAQIQFQRSFGGA
jgi:hypothetical protein